MTALQFAESSLFSGANAPRLFGKAHGSPENPIDLSEDKPKRDTQHPNWTCTLYPHCFISEAGCVKIIDAIGEKSKYAVFGFEICPRTGTSHVQAFAMFKTRKRLSELRKLFHHSIHWEPMRGSVDQNFRYVTKEYQALNPTGYTTVGGTVFPPGTRVAPEEPIIFGEKPASDEENGAIGGDKERERWRRALEAAKSGDMNAVDPQIYICHLPNIERIAAKSRRLRAPVIPLPDTCGIWLWGESGSGKTHYATHGAGVCQDPTRLYRKNPRTEWWCHFDDELHEFVLLDDVDPTMSKLASEVKTWTDQWPFPANAKQLAARDLRPKNMIVTSNYTIQEVFGNSPDLPALLRRFEVIYFPVRFDKKNMTEPVMIRYPKGAGPSREECRASAGLHPTGHVHIEGTVDDFVTPTIAPRLRRSVAVRPTTPPTWQLVSNEDEVRDEPNPNSPREAKKVVFTIEEEDEYKGDTQPLIDRINNPI